MLWSVIFFFTGFFFGLSISFLCVKSKREIFVNGLILGFVFLVLAMPESLTLATDSGADFLVTLLFGMIVPLLILANRIYDTVSGKY